MIRFKIDEDNKDPAWTEWEPEHVRQGLGPHTAVQRMSELRQIYGVDARISIERTTVIPEGDHRQVRFKIVDGDMTWYSMTYPIAEKDARRAEIEQKFPNAVITEEIIGNE